VSFSDRELELDEPCDLAGLPWGERMGGGDGFLSPLPSSGRSASLAAQLRTERSGRDTPASVDSIPLEWDHDYDLSRGLESASRALREQQGEEGDFLQRPTSALSGRCHPDLYRVLTTGGVAMCPITPKQNATDAFVLYAAKKKLSPFRIQTPLNVSLLVSLQPFAKIKKVHFSSH